MSPNIQNESDLNEFDNIESNIGKSALNCSNKKEASSLRKRQPLDNQSAKEVKDTPIDLNDIKIETGSENAVSCLRNLLNQQSCQKHIKSFQCYANSSDVEPESVTVTPIQKSKQNQVSNLKIVSNKTQGQNSSKPVLRAKKTTTHGSDDNHLRVPMKRFLQRNKVNIRREKMSREKF